MFEPGTANGPAAGLARPREAGSLRLAVDEVHVWCAGLDVPPDTYARLYATLPEDERNRSARFRSRSDHQHFIVSHGVLRELLGRYLQVPTDRVRYRCNAFGKPDLAHELGSRIRFNLSHAAGLALIAIAAESDVGVDVERIQPESHYRHIARNFFSATEADQLRALPADRQAEAFVACWTAKEACLKACGAGLTIPLDQVVVPLTADPAGSPKDVHVPPHDLVPGSRWTVHALRPAPGYVGALAIEERHRRVRQWRWRIAA
jgi:4'-phosphopantetheinyl transferase